MTKALTGANKEDEKKHSCDWKGCKGNPHSRKIKYEEREKGNVSRGKLVGCWPKPFHISTPSYEQYGVKEGKFCRLSSSKYGYVKSYDSSRSDYIVEYHHVIPVDSLKGKDTLKDNLKLMGWNINDGISNGICLPYFKEDQIWHWLQPHRGSHPINYISAVDEMLAPLDSICENYCASSEKKLSKEDQDTLIAQTIEMVEDLRKDILNWEVKIHLDSTLNNWTNQILSRRIGTSIGYFRDGASESTRPPDIQKGKSPRKYLE